MKKLLKRIIILLIIAAAVYAGLLFSGMLPSQKTENTQYRTETIARGTIANVITATGNISPEETVTVGAQVSGKIMGIYAKLNDTVKVGQLLAEIDPAIPLEALKQSKNNLETSELSYANAQRDYERTKIQVSKEYLPKRDLESSYESLVGRRVGLESAKIQVRREEINLSYTKVTSPIDGVIIKQEVSSGQTLASNFQSPNLFTIAKDLSVMKIDMNMPESDISKVHVGMPVSFTVDAFEGRQFSGIIDVIDLNPNNQSGVVTYNVIVKLENKDRALFPGMTANITITLSEVADILRVPAAALRFSPPEEMGNPLTRMFASTRRSSPNPEDAMQGMQTVYVLRGGTLVMVPVSVGASDDFYVEIRDGALKEGDVVVTGLPVQEE